jgi:RNA polymerase sigma factor (sigma-70 family)
MAPKDPFADPGPLIRRVYGYVAYRIGHGPDAEDLTSEVFERALRYRSSYDPARGGPLPWLLAIARRCIESRRPLPLPGASVADGAAPGDLETSVVERLTLSVAISALDERSRDLLALRYGADLSTRQIAAILELKANTVDVALHRALDRLGKQLDDPAQGGGGRFRVTEPAPDA